MLALRLRQEQPYEFKIAGQWVLRPRPVLSNTPPRPFQLAELLVLARLIALSLESVQLRLLLRDPV